MKTIPQLFFAVLLVAVMSSLAKADEMDLQALQQSVQSLQQRVEALEAVKPTITSLMPNFAERFHVMHRAGESGDWAVAGHELQEMKRLAALARYIDVQKGTLMQDMMDPSFEALEHAIEHGNQKKFQTALEGTVTTCNACHVVSGSPFIQVTLDAKDTISIRPPHVFTRSEVIGGHTHGTTATMQNMQTHMENTTGDSSDQDHHDSDQDHHDDETGDDEHEDETKHQD